MSAVSLILPESLRRRAAILAADDGISLDQFVATALAEKVAVLDADSYVRERAARGSREKFERVLAMVPDVDCRRNRISFRPHTLLMPRPASAQSERSPTFPARSLARTPTAWALQRVTPAVQWTLAG